MVSTYVGDTKPPLIRDASQYPAYQTDADVAYGGTTTYENLKFVNFKSGYNWCGAEQRLFRLNPQSADYIPKVNVVNPTLINVDQDALAFLFTPPNTWATIDDCGEFPCTGPNNVLI